MIVLNSTTKLQLVLSAGTADVDVTFNDRTTTAYGPSDSQQTAATATTNDICTAPAASTSREINGISVNYKTTGGTATLQKLNSSGAVVTKIASFALITGDNLSWTHANGLKITDINGQVKLVMPGYLPLTGGTLSGALTGTTATFSGTVTPQALLDISGASAGQIQFPSTQNPSAGANVLDDYEEGTWTPSDASGAGLTFSNVTTAYEKIGRLVRAAVQLSFPATADGTASSIGGLPFTIANVGGSAQGFISTCTETTAQVFKPIANTLTVNIRTNANADVTNATLSGDTVVGCAIYNV